MSRIGLVLEGGGMRGIYTAGVLDVMIEKGFHPDVICGTSAGVTFGVNLPSRQKGRVLRYNECLRKIARLRDEGKVIVIQPQSPLRIGRLEKDRDKIRHTHALGVQDAEALWDRIEAYLNA